jgi:molybdenum cofactor biosynthesis enzyme MoaA
VDSTAEDAEIRDEREMTLADIGDTYFVDFETGRQVRVDTGDPKLRQRFEEAARIERAAVGRAILGSGAEHCVLTTSGDWLRPFAAFLSKGRLRR